MAQALRVLVVGATGQQGGALTNELLARGHTVRGQTRDINSPAAKALTQRNVEMVQGNLMDPMSLKKAAEDADVAFFMTTPFEDGVEAEAQQGLNAVKVFADARVPHVVFSSVANADQDTGIPHFESKARVESRLKESGLHHTIVAPVFFRENLVGPMARAALVERKLRLGLPEERGLQVISLKELGAILAHVVENHRQLNGVRIDVASETVTPLEMADALTAASGEIFEYEEVPLAALRAQNEDFAQMFEWFQRVGYSVDIDRLRNEYPEVPWQTTAEWADGYDWSWLEEAAPETA